MWRQSLHTHNRKPTGVAGLLRAQLTTHLKYLSPTAKDPGKCSPLISWLFKWLKTRTLSHSQKLCTSGLKLPHCTLIFCTSLFMCVSWAISPILEVSLLWYNPPTPKPSHAPRVCLHEFAVLQLIVTPLTNSYRIPLIPDIARNNFLPLREGKQPWKFIQPT